MKDKTTDRTASVLLIGYYGFNNIGDEAMLDSIIRGFIENSEVISLTVLSRNPPETAEKYNVMAVNRYSLFRIIRAIKKSSLVVFGGGNIFQNSTSSRSLLYYLSLIYIASISRKKLMLLGNGIGPIKGKFLLKKTANLLNKISIITLRDKISRDFLIENKINKPLIKITADPVFSLPKSTTNKSHGTIDREKKAAVSLRSCRRLNTGILAEYFDFLIAELGCSITFFPMQPNKDLQIINKVIKMMNTDPEIIDKALTHQDFPEILNSFDFVIGMRLHSLIFAAMNEKPFLSIEYDPKVLSITEDLGQVSLGNPSKFDIKLLKAKTENFLDNMGVYRENVKTGLESKITLSDENFKIALSLMEGK